MGASKGGGVCLLPMAALTCFQYMRRCSHQAAPSRPANHVRERSDAPVMTHINTPPANAARRSCLERSGLYSVQKE